jgi:putative peptide modification system cyclase
MNDFGHPASAPQVRTLLLTDLCDSTLLVERLGDGPAAELFRAHDRLVLELQQRWRGRLIDRSDGLLLLFERPVDGLGFALDYARGLRELGERPEVKQRKLELRARAGLHVGEVLTWQNSEAAVQAGAKPLEVEGIAKPLAGRLMALARPGQILLSATAEPLARRASRELGERAETLIWKSHGRWRFKGLPDGQEIFEVGEPGHAPLRAPKQNTGKAWRDIPLWRRPAALAAELLLVVGMGTGLWFITKPTPAIAFNERDWVVVGDLRNLTGQPVLDESLEQAFRISLEQSRYVNVLSDLKVRDTLQLMKRSADTKLDRAIASEIAIRDGARAVILPTVAEVGGRVRVSAEVIDPHTQTTVYAESADGKGAESALGSIDHVTGELRERLGEAIASIERDSAPLPQVSTSNLDALKTYALGERKMAAGDAVAALGYYRKALELDPQFALAGVAIGRLQIAQGQLAEGRKQLEQAAALGTHLTAREKMSLDTLLARFGPVTELLARWKQITEIYPDMLPAQLGYAQDGWMLANRYTEMLPHARAASLPQSPHHARGHYLQGMLLLGVERYADAEKAFRQSRASGFKGGGFSQAYVHEARREYQQADRVFAARAGTSLDGRSSEDREYAFVTNLDRGHWSQAREALRGLIDLSAAQGPELVTSGFELWDSATAVAGGTREPRLAKQLAWAETHASELDAVVPLLSDDYRIAIAYMAARTSDLAVLKDAVRALGNGERLRPYPMRWQGYQVVLAENERLSGKAPEAVRRLQGLARQNDALLMVHSAYGRALADAGDPAGALAEANWLASHRGRAFVERGTSQLLDPLNIADTTLAHLVAAELLVKLEHPQQARAELKAFLGAWQPAGLPSALALRVADVERALRPSRPADRKT